MAQETKAGDRREGLVGKWSAKALDCGGPVIACGGLIIQSPEVAAAGLGLTVARMVQFNHRFDKKHPGYNARQATFHS